MLEEESHGFSLDGTAQGLRYGRLGSLRYKGLPWFCRFHYEISGLTMNNKSSDSGLPEEVLGLLSTLFFVPTIAVLAAAIFPVIASAGGLTYLYWGGVVAGVVGMVLLFFARLPFYRQRRFLVFGPRELDRSHRRLYWLAYAVLLVSTGLFGMVWLGTKLTMRP
jgi:hypothetical protein